MVMHKAKDISLTIIECIEKVVEDKALLLKVTNDTNLFEDDIIDSVAAVELVVIIEKIFSIKLSDDEIFSEEFSTIDGIASLVMKKLSQ